MVAMGTVFFLHLLCGINVVVSGVFLRQYVG